MISTLSHSSVPLPKCRPRSVAPSSSPCTGTPDQDSFVASEPTNISQVKRALQEPIMDPGFQAAVGLGLAGVAFGGAIGFSLAASTVAKSSSENGMKSETTVTSNSLQESRVGGSAEGSLLSGSFTVSEEMQTAHWKTQGGAGAVDLTFALKPGNEEMTLDGTIGSVPAHLVYTGVETEGDEVSLLVSGTVGGLPYNVTTTLDSLPGAKGESNFGMTSQGTVGGLAIDKSYVAVSDVDHESGFGILNFTGEGINAGEQQTLEVSTEVFPL